MLSNSCVPSMSAAASAARRTASSSSPRRARTRAVEIFSWERPLTSIFWMVSRATARCSSASSSRPCWARTPASMAARCPARARSPVPSRISRPVRSSRSAASGLPALSSSGAIENGWSASASSWPSSANIARASSRSSRPVSSSPCNAMSDPITRFVQAWISRLSGCCSRISRVSAMPSAAGVLPKRIVPRTMPSTSRSMLLLPARWACSIDRNRGSRIESHIAPAHSMRATANHARERPSSSPTRSSTSIARRESASYSSGLKSETSIAWNESSIRARTRRSSRSRASAPAMARSSALREPA